MKKDLTSSKIIILAILVGLCTGGYIYAQTSSPTGNNSNPPLNVGSGIQYKKGGITSEGLAVWKAFQSISGATLNSTVNVQMESVPPYTPGELSVTKDMTVTGVSKLSTASVGILKLPKHVTTSQAPTPLCADTAGNIVKC